MERGGEEGFYILLIFKVLEDLEKSIFVQRFGVASKTFLQDRQTCVIVVRGIFV